MKALLVCLLLIIPALVLAQQPHNPDIETRYDRFADATTVKLSFPLTAPGVVDLGNGSVYSPPDSKGSSFLLSVIAIVPGTKLTALQEVTFLVTARSREWIYLRVPTVLRVIQNGTDRLEIGEMKRVNSKAMLDGVIEQLILDVPFSTVVKLAASSKLEMQIALDEFELRPEQIKALKDWVGKFPPPLTPSRSKKRK